MIEKVEFRYTEDITAVNKEQYEAHLRLYENYVEKMNEIDRILEGNPPREDANTTFSSYRELKRGETFALNGVILHELYFQNMGGHMEPNQQTREAIEEFFNSFQSWKEDFIATAKASRGWAVMAFDQRTYKIRNISLDAHDHGNIAYYAPFLILDVYEHAYWFQYADNKEAYINNFMDNINWNIVSQRMNITQ